MSLDSRIVCMLLGCLIGFILGYIVRSLRDVEEHLEQVDAAVNKRAQRDNGAVRMNTLSNITLLIVLVVTVWAAIASQIASHDVHRTQNKIAVSTSCNQDFLTKTIAALNARTQYSSEQGTANVALQRAQSKYLAVVLEIPQTTNQVRYDALQIYFKRLTAFTEVSGKTNTAVKNHPYPKPQALRDCISKG